MDAVLFVKEYQRMCRRYIKHGCEYCKLASHNNGFYLVCEKFIFEKPEEAVRIVEQWNKENPIKTNRNKFHEVFGNASVNDLFIADQIEGTHLFGIKQTDWWEQEYIES